MATQQRLDATKHHRDHYGDYADLLRCHDTLLAAAEEMQSHWYMRLAWKIRRYVGCVLGRHTMRKGVVYCLMGCGHYRKEGGA